jgi:hypothetical protein
MAGTHHVVVDGSNLATEGRSTPSLAQLDEAVRAYLAEDPTADVVVVVDASFSHRIEEKERAQLEAAELHGEVVAPPAGAIGRGDAFVLRIAERTGAVVLSNDSFQEFHEEHPWLFDEGRLIGGKPVPGVGWIFTPRRPVRGPRSKKKERGGERGDAEAELSAPRKAAEVAKALKKTASKGASAGAKAARAFESAESATVKPGKGSKDGKAGKPGRAAKAAKPEADAGTKPKKSPAKTSTRRTEAKAAKAEAAKGAKALQRPKVEKAPRKAAAGPSEPPAERAKKAPAAAAAAKATKVVERAAKKSADKAAKSTRRVGVKAAINRATAEVLAPPEPPGTGDGSSGGRRRRRPGPPPAVNEPLAFITFVAEHPIGSTFDGVVASFTSHGAMVDVALEGGGVLHCYAPLTGLGSPAPRTAREVLKRGEQRAFALVGLDPPRRMAELALAGVSGDGGDRRKAPAAG